MAGIYKIDPNTLTPRYVQGRFSTAITFDIEAIEKSLGFSWSGVEEYWVKYGTLHMRLKDGTVHEMEGMEDEPDHKHPYETQLLSADYDVIETDAE